MARKNILQHYWASITVDYFNFKGRARRMEFWGFTLISFIVSLLLGGIDDGIYGSVLGLINATSESHWYNQFLRLSGIYDLLVIIPTLAVGIRRFHDLGKFGWLVILWTAIGVTPMFSINTYGLVSSGFGVSPGLGWVLVAALLIAAIWLLVMLLTEGDKGPNKYGPDPKNPEVGNELDQIGTE